MDDVQYTVTETRPTIFLVEEDDDARLIFAKELRGFGYRLLVSADLEDAQEWLNGNGHIKADLFLINLVGKTAEEALSVGRELRELGKCDEDTPLVVIPEDFAEGVKATNVHVSGNDWICNYDDSGQLQTLLGRLTAQTRR